MQIKQIYLHNCQKYLTNTFKGIKHGQISYQNTRRSQAQHGWGAKVIDQLSKDPKSEFPDMKGFSPQNLKYMRRFAESYELNEISQQAVDQLP